MPALTLTPKQKEILDFILTFYDQRGYSPSLAEIAHNFKKSIPTIHQFVETLRTKGLLNKKEHISRSITPKKETEIFLLGRIAAGKPIEPIENPEPIKVPDFIVSAPGNYYSLEVRGDSMIEDGILDGDIIVVKHQNTAENGDTIIAITEDGATLKKFKRINDKIVLEPRNKKLKNIIPKKLDIRGKFIGLLRKDT